MKLEIDKYDFARIVNAFHLIDAKSLTVNSS